MTDSLLVQAFIYLAAAVILVPLAKRFALGSVLGYLLAGVVIGPHVLKLVGENGTDVRHFAEFGVVMMLFLVGLELKPTLLWKLRLPILGLGSLQVFVTALILGAGATLFNLPVLSAIGVGLALAMSSTAIALQSLTEKRLLKTPGGQASFAVLLFQDLSVIPILALLPFLVVFPSNVEAGHISGLGNSPAWLQTLWILGAVLTIVVGGKYLLRPVFRFIAATGLREIFTAFALLLVIGIALLMESVGLSAALGTFLAGVVLAENEYRHELEGDIEPFKGLLLGLFFISVGAGINLPYMKENILLIMSLSLGLLLVKGGLLWWLGRRFGLDQKNAIVFGLSLAQVGEFAFVLFGLSVQKGVLTEAWSQPLVAVTVMSMFLTPLLFLVYEKMFVSKKEGQTQTGEADAIEKKAPVIIAGFGKMGNIIGRLLRSNGIDTNVLDLNPRLIENVRKLGLKAHYGDATRLDLLIAAGAQEAKVLIIAIDEPEKTLELTKLAQKQFPHLKIIARSKERFDTYALIQLGVTSVKRESFGTAIDLGYEALVALGFRANRAYRAAQAYKKYNEKAVSELALKFGNEKELHSILKDKIAQEEGMLTDKEIDLDLERAWDNESLKNDYTEAVLGKKSENPGKS